MRSSTSVPAPASLQITSLPPMQFAAFPHAGQAKMPLAPLPRQNRWIDAFSIVPHTKPELLIVIPDFNLDLPSRGMVKGVAERLSGNPVDFIAQNRMQIARLTFHGDAKCRSAVVGWISGQFLTQRVHRPCKVICFDRGGAQSLHRVPAFGDRLGGPINRSVQLFLCLHGALRQQLGNDLKPQHQPLEALKQGVMQFPRDACPLSHARLQVRAKSWRNCLTLIR